MSRLSGEPARAAWMPSRWGPREALLLALAAMAAIALALPGARGLTDDAFLRFQFARNVARGDGYALVPGVPTYGVASPLWVGLLAAADRAIPGGDTTPASPSADPPLAWAARALGAAFAALAVLLLAAAATRAGWGPGVALAAAALLALDQGAARWTLSGLETPLALALATAALALLARALLERRSAAWAGAVLGLGIAARPEFLLLALAALGAIAWGVEPLRRARRLGGFAAGFLLAAAPWWAIAAAAFHRVIPNAAPAPAGGWLDPERALAALRTAIRVVLAADAVPVAVAVLVLALLRPWGALESDRGRRAFWWMVLAWPLLLAVAFASGMGRVAARTFVPAAPCVILIGIAALRWAWATWPARRRLAALLTVLLAALAQNVAGTAFVGGPRAAREGALLRASLADIGRWARAHTPKGAVIAAPDVGAIAFYSDRPVVDLSGRATPRLAPIVARDGYDAIVWNLRFESVARPSLLVDRADRANRLAPPDDPSTPYRFLFSRIGPEPSVAGSGTAVYSVYAIDWERYDRLHPRVAARD